MHAYAEMTVGEAADFALIPEGMDFETAASLPLVMLTGEQLVREGGKVQAGQTVLVTGALGSVGRSAVHAALKTGCRVIAGVRGSQKADVESLRVADVVALDDEADIQRLAPFDVVADTVGGAIAERLTATVKPGGIFASVVALPKDAGSYPHVQFTRIMAHPESATLSRMAAEVQNGEFSIPIGLRLPLAEAARAQAAGEKGGVGKILLIP
jgi:NADPH:quinone reductase-like Zn-dependent oxidoreductase